MDRHTDESTHKPTNKETHKGYSGLDGSFSLSGGRSETTDIDPVLKIYHDGNDVGLVSVPKPGICKLTFLLPGKYIFYEKLPKKTMDIGAINLELEFKDEGRERVQG